MYVGSGKCKMALLLFKGLCSEHSFDLRLWLLRHSPLPTRVLQD